MGFFLNLSTKAKLMTSFLVVIAINLLIVGAVVITMNNVQKTASTVERVLTQAFSRSSAIQSSVDEVNNFFVVSLNPGDTRFSAKEIGRQAPAMIQKLEDAYSRINPEAVDIPGYRDETSVAREELKTALITLQNDVSPLFDKGDYNGALQAYLMKTFPTFASAKAHLNKANSLQADYCIALAQQSADNTPVIIIICMASFGSILGICLALYISGYISRSLNYQMGLLEAMADGDFSRSISHTANADEFGRSLEVTRRVRNSLNNIINMTKDESNKLQNEMRKIQQISQDISYSSSNVQNQAVTVAAAADEMVSTTADIARNCESAAAGSSTCTEITRTGLSEVENAVSNIRQQAVQTKDNASKIESLARQSNDIGSIVGTIDDIAAQTNLLALNAAIEAARAGEAGRGFAVVADEVRALASRTTQSTKEISRMIKNIQDEAKVATESINSSVSHMDTVAQDAEHIMSILNDITNRVSTVNQQIVQIATSAEEQTAATAEISANMQNVTNATDEMSSQADHAHTSMEGAFNDLIKLNDALRFFKTSVKQA